MKVCIIGAGISGIVSAIICKLNNLDFIIFEKSKSIGGCWYNLAKDHTYLQTLGTEYTIFYKYFLGEFSNETKPRNFVYLMGIDFLKNSFSANNKSFKYFRNFVISNLNKNNLAKDFVYNIANKGFRF